MLMMKFRAEHWCVTSNFPPYTAGLVRKAVPRSSRRDASWRRPTQEKKPLVRILPDNGLSTGLDRIQFTPLVKRTEWRQIETSVACAVGFLNRRLLSRGTA